ncbi:MAG: type VI secretion system tip protein VgrG [Planctomycetota bacterium]|nr:type VI secretion system tip protein VgrG [Planctomycetaceae bacterium]MDQ3331111.1 type VI secretion system tip protein VgrG [Planctomycetota bacterium]
MTTATTEEVKQDGRLLQIKTTLPSNTLLVHQFTASESVSHLFSVDVELVAQVHKAGSVSADALLGRPATISVELQDKSHRHFQGIISRFSQGGRDARFQYYHAEIVPWLWLLTRRFDCRVFQNKTVPDIIKTVFEKAGFQANEHFRFALTGEHTKRDYCVQYRESDFNFVSRLMEEEGIFYFFEHSEDKHVLVLADASDLDKPCKPCPGLKNGEVRFLPEAGMGDREDCITSWQVQKAVRSGMYSLRDYNFQTPKNALEVMEVGRFNVGGNHKLEIYDYPGEHAQPFNKPDQRLGEMEPEGSRIGRIRIEEEEAGHVMISGNSYSRALTPGFRIQRIVGGSTGSGKPDAEGPCVLTSIHHTAHQSPDYFSDNETGVSYFNSFTAIPHSVRFRTPRVTPRPVIVGIQTAVVVGEPKEEISVDKYGRIRVQFHWDREGKKDEDSSCWIRVGQSAAGTQWGTYFWPRIGHEVLVAFLEGDPDAPIVVGSVYNFDNMPPYTLPDHKTRSGIKTRSSLKGNENHFNEIRFEDKKGSEEIYVHAEHDMNRVVENNDTVKIGFSDKDKGDQTTDIHNNQTYTVGSDGCEDGSQLVFVWNNHEMTIGQGGGKAADGSQLVSIWNSQEVTIGKGEGQCSDGSQIVSIYKDRTVTLKTGNDTLEIATGNRTSTLKMGNDDLAIKMGNQTTKLDLGASSTEAMQAIELKVGQSSIKIDQMGVTIKGMMIKVEGTVQTSVKGLMTQVDGSAMLMVKGGIAMIN